MEGKKPVSLYLVATPIGNMNDISPRALETLEKADFIAAEDTRVTGKLLARYGIKKPLISYYEHNMMQRGEVILERLRQGEVCALVSDAGMPAISDPGEMIVRQCVEEGFKVSAIPGPCAMVCALAMSGLSTKRFTFEGFLSTAKNSRREHLLSLKDDTHTLVFYEAPHKLLGTLEDMLEYLGDRKIALVREISKIYEEAIQTSLSQAVEEYKDKNILGEFVIIVEGAKKKEQPAISENELEKEFLSLTESGKSKTEAAKELAAKYGMHKRDIYEMFK
jgi:16S rRNA (cytidine1402-2'-O)-methyltransferase